MPLIQTLDSMSHPEPEHQDGSPAKDPKSSPPFWPPVTFGRTARFALIPYRVLAAWQAIAAASAALLLLFMFEKNLSPAWEAVVEEWPDSMSWKNGKLEWEGEANRELFGTRFFAFRLGFEKSEGTADWRIGFGMTRWQVCSLFGCADFRYPAAASERSLNRIEVLAWWHAWKSWIAAALCAGAICLLFLSWGVLGLMYGTLVWFASIFSDRIITLTGAWKMAQAALVPAAFLQAAFLAAYCFGFTDLLVLLFGSVLHLALGIVYLIGAARRVPMRPSPLKENPFTAAAPGSPKNPFTTQ